MTPDEQRLAIAKIHRPELVKAHDDANRMLKAITNGIYPIVELEPYPRYLHDLNAMHEAEKTLSRVQEWDSNGERLLTQWQKYEQCLKLRLDASAPERAQAFLRTLGKWTE